MTDSYGLTVNSEIARMLQRITGMVFIVILFWFNLLHLTSLFFLNYLDHGIIDIRSGSHNTQRKL